MAHERKGQSERGRSPGRQGGARDVTGCCRLSRRAQINTTGIIEQKSIKKRKPNPHTVLPVNTTTTEHWLAESTRLQYGCPVMQDILKRNECTPPSRHRQESSRQPRIPNIPSLETTEYRMHPTA